MTITVTPEPTFAPPRNVVELSVPAGNVMTEVEVWRNDPSGRVALRSQPLPGFDSRTVFDFECPFGVPVTYEWAAGYVDPDAATVVFSDNYSTYSTGWTGAFFFGSVASSALTFAPVVILPAGSSGGEPEPFFESIQRDVTAVGWSTISVARLASTSARTERYTLLFSGGGSLALGVDSSGLRFTARPTASASPVVVTRAGFNTTDPLTVSRFGAALEIRQGANVVSAQVTLGDFVGVRLTADYGSTLTVGALAVSVQTLAPATISETSDLVTLVSDDAWLIAPQSPGLSFPLGRADALRAGFASQPSSAYESNATVHRILGARLPVTTVSGPRSGEQMQLAVRTVSDDEREQLLGLLGTDFPVLMNVPPSWGVGLPYAFFQAGDVSVSRVSPVGTLQDREFRFELVEVRPPISDVENVGWDYAELASTFATYTAVRAGFASYADLEANVRA
jgi:hypothetical protein